MRMPSLPLAKKAFLLKTSARRFKFPVRWLGLKGMRFCSPQMRRKPDSQEGATLPTSMFALNMNSMDQTDTGCPIKAMDQTDKVTLFSWKGKEFTYIFQLMSIRRARSFPWPWQPKWAPAGCCQVVTRAHWGSPKATGIGKLSWKNDHSAFVTVFGTAL